LRVEVTGHETRAAEFATAGTWSHQTSYGQPSPLRPVADLRRTSAWFPLETGHEGQFYEELGWMSLPDERCACTPHPSSYIRIQNGKVRHFERKPNHGMTISGWWTLRCSTEMMLQICSTASSSLPSSLKTT